MKVLITGATGLVGSEIVRQCHSLGHTVHYLTTRKEKIEDRSDYRGFLWNPEKGEIDASCFSGVDTIINLAGASISKRWTSDHKKRVLQSRVDSLRTLRKALASSGEKIQSFISASAIGIYPSSLEELYTEEHEGVDDSFLGRVVAQWEAEADTFKDMGFPVAKVRIGLVMSKDGGALPEIARPVNNYAGAAFGSGEQWQSWIHIEDLGRIFLFLATHKLAGTYNGVGPNPVTNNKLVKEVAKVLEKPLLLPNIPKFMMRLVLGEMAFILFASQRVSSKKIAEEGFSFKYVNVCTALEAIYDGKSTNKVGSELNNQYSS